ncbi:CAP domain-containing protein [Spirosoma sp. BT702]|uniref:CAP domain-containing protein n=1 Tax=Spirosoma profusum TaxID=2771354 RepID=A0A926Y0Y9_9BACT|nr:CAP domain-containing protein [Spirosoma profusum]MBD2704452.1 CAP domain-containing protein [Spirosoma profusum]
MNWWIVFQLGQWLCQITSPQELYSLSDQAFFAQSIALQPMVLNKPDTTLLDIALFQATNEARRLAGVAPLQYDPALFQAARNHAESMIQFDYVAHEDFYQLDELTLLKRIQKQTHRFGRVAENIGQYQTLDTAEWYGIRFNTRRQQYEYLDAESKQLYQPYNYAQYARYAVSQWLNSPHHRANLLNPAFTHVGCAGRLSRAPFKQRRAPFGRLVQNFGIQRLATQISR